MIFLLLSALVTIMSLGVIIYVWDMYFKHLPNLQYSPYNLKEEFWYAAYYSVVCGVLIILTWLHYFMN